MKNIIVILLMLPVVTFGSLLEPFFIGKKFNLNNTADSRAYWVELKPNNQTNTPHEWWINGGYLYISQIMNKGRIVYFFPIYNGITSFNSQDCIRIYGNQDYSYSISVGGSDPSRFFEYYFNSNKPNHTHTTVSDEVKKLLIDLKGNSSLFQSWDECIEYYAEDKLRSWQKQGEFEKVADHKKRLNQDSITNMKVKFHKEAVSYYKQMAVSSIINEDIYLNKYNPELELFPIEISDFGNFNLPVPISKAPSFKENFKGSNLSSLDFDLVNGKFTVSYFEIDGFIYNSTGATLRYDENGALIK